MNITTEPVIVNASQEDIYNFLINFNNFEQLLPEDKIENWSSTNTDCSFRIKGMTDIGMKINKSNPNSTINIISHGKNPFSFTLDISIENKNNSTVVTQKFNGDINPFMKMMVEKPLSNFFNMLSKKLVEIYS